LRACRNRNSRYAATLEERKTMSEDNLGSEGKFINEGGDLDGVDVGVGDGDGPQDDIPDPDTFPEPLVVPSFEELSPPIQPVGDPSGLSSEGDPGPRPPVDPLPRNLKNPRPQDPPLDQP
jgi:hypothetical protein